VTPTFLQQLPSLQLIIEAVKGASYQGDIAIDGISFLDGACKSSVTISPTAVSPGATPTSVARTCDFESQTICGWTQDKNDDFDWSWDSNGTPTTGTGPSTDHTYGTRNGKVPFINMRLLFMKNSSSCYIHGKCSCVMLSSVATGCAKSRV
jgi:hypothetical protein